MRIGTDIVEVSRIERAIKNWQTDFLHRVFTQQENIKINREDPNYERASGFWAAKEAVVKALGCGYRDGITFKDIEIGHDELGCPHFIFFRASKRDAYRKAVRECLAQYFALSELCDCRCHTLLT